jgi:hypothetical protein
MATTGTQSQVSYTEPNPMAYFDVLPSTYYAEYYEKFYQHQFLVWQEEFIRKTQEDVNVLIASFHQQMWVMQAQYHGWMNTGMPNRKNRNNNRNKNKKKEKSSPPPGWSEEIVEQSKST